MNRRKFLLGGAAAGGTALVSGSLDLFAQRAMLPTVPTLVSGGAAEVGDRAQLFIDRLLVRSAEHVDFTVHPAQKHPLNPLIKADQPWEGWWVRVLGGAVLFD